MALFFLLFVGGPISIGLLLSPRWWRGVVAGLVTVVAIPVAFSLAGIVSSLMDNQLLIGVIVAIIVILQEIITGDVGRRAEIVGLGIGLAVGLILIVVNISLVGTFIYTGNDKLLLVSFYPPNALVWLSALFFPEWVSGKVGRGGVIVWIVLLSTVFGLSFILMK